MKLPALILCATAWFFLGCAPEVPEEATPLDLIPGSSSALVKINDPEQFRADYRNNPLLKALLGSLKETTWMSSLPEMLALDPPPGTISAFGGDGYTGEWLLIIPPPNGPAQGVAVEGSATDSSLVQEPIWQLPDSTGAIFREYRGIGLVGSSKEFVEAAISNAHNPPVGLGKALRASNPLAEASIFLPPDPYQNASSDTEALSGIDPTWSVFDVLSSPGSLSLQTMDTGQEGTAPGEDLLRGQPVLPLQKVAGIIPETASSWVSYSLQRPGQFRLQQETFLGKTLPDSDLLESVEQLSLVEWERSILLIIHSLNTPVMEEELGPFRGEALEFQGNLVYPISDNELLRETFVPLLDGLPKAAYYCAFEDAFVFSESLEAMQALISHKNRNATYDQTAAFQKLRPSIAATSNTLLISENPKNSRLLKDTLIAGTLREGILNVLPENYTVATQLNLDRGFTLRSLQFVDPGMGGEDTPRVRETFTVSLSAAVANRPQFLINHRSGDMDLAVQDAEHVLYLFSSTGELFWKKELPGPIQGEIHQVDLFRNGRLQMAFTTDTQLIVLDRDGKDVAPFPRNFPGGNLGPLALFDYENNRNYRLVVTQGARVFMYDSQGEDVKGFKFRDAGSPVISIPVHVRFGSRDYLVFQLENGELRILNRVGDTRIRVRERFDFSNNPVRAYREGFAFTDRKGDLIRIDTRGRVNRTPLNLNPDHGMDATSRTLALMDDNRFRVKSNRQELELGVYTRPRIFYLFDIIYVAVTDLQSQQVYLFRSTAAPVSGFPVEGSGLADMADMDNDRSPELATPYRNKQVRVYSLR